MADEAQFHLRHLNGVESLDRFIASLSEMGISEWQHISAATNIHMFGLHLANVKSAGLEDNGSLKKFREQILARPHAQIVELRAEHNQFAKVSYHAADGLTARVGYTITEQARQQGNADERSLRIADALHAQFAFAPRSDIVLNLIPETYRTSLQYQEATASELRQSVQELGRIAAEQIRDYNKILQEKLADLEKGYEQKRTGLEEEYQKKDAAIGEREREFQKQVAEFNTKGRMVARRDYSKDLQKLLEAQKEITVSKRSEGKRLPVHIVCIAAMALFGGAMGLMIFQIATGKLTDLHAAWPLSLATLGFGGILIFYLRFIYQWFAELAGAEFSTRKQLNDLVRANWVAELFLESKETSQIDIPPELLNNFTRNLFTDFDWKHRVQHPMETAIDSLTKAKSIEVSPQGGVKVQQK